METINRNCGSCVIRQQPTKMCPIFNQPMEDTELGCPMHTGEIRTCDICSKVIVGSVPLIDITELDHLRTVCPTCKKQYNKCPSCFHVGECLFETDPSPIPKVVQQEIRQGNMISVTQVKNPSRIEITCKKNCPCFSQEFGCLKENNTCGNYKIRFHSR